MNGLPVDVTIHYIEAGKMTDPTSCPIALAIRDQHPELAPLKLKVYGSYIESWEADLRVFATLSRRADRFVARFDNAGSDGVVPSRFILKLTPGARTRLETGKWPKAKR